MTPRPVSHEAVAEVLRLLSEGASDQAIVDSRLLPDHVRICPDCRALEVPAPDCATCNGSGLVEADALAETLAALDDRGLLLSNTEPCLNCGKVLAEHEGGRCKQ